MSTPTPNILATDPSYRPTIIEGGSRHNHLPHAKRAGWPWVTDRWRIWQIEDGVMTWQNGEKSLRCTPGMWVIQQADRVVSHMMTSPGARWSQLRFRLFPQNADGDAASLRTFGRQIPISLTAEESEPFRPTLADILAWWWRDPWHRLQAETRLSSLLVQLAALDGDTTTVPAKAPVWQDAFQAADRIWITRPLAPLSDLAQACGMSERTFRRRFRTERGVTPAAYARIRMTEQACDLMRQKKDWSISTIARHLGYSHTSAFVRAFRNELNTTPQRWQMNQQARS